jgi:peptidoglycan/xylan/chitin deacetylase (PgdA/CDA1 family)
VSKCAEFVPGKLFRPPYGKIKRSQINLLKHDYEIIMWDVLSKDYDQSLSGEDCFKRVRKNVCNGSVVVFHDSVKAEKRLRYALPATLDYFSERGFKFSTIKDSLFSG